MSRVRSTRSLSSLLVFLVVTLAAPLLGLTSRAEALVVDDEHWYTIDSVMYVDRQTALVTFNLLCPVGEEAWAEQLTLTQRYRGGPLSEGYGGTGSIECSGNVQTFQATVVDLWSRLGFHRGRAYLSSTFYLGDAGYVGEARVPILIQWRAQATGP
jgi:hypothetical protein